MNVKFQLPDISYSIPDIQDYFQYVLKKHGKNTDNPSIRICVYKWKTINKSSNF